MLEKIDILAISLPDLNCQQSKPADSDVTANQYQAAVCLVAVNSLLAYAGTIEVTQPWCKSGRCNNQPITYDG